MAPAVVLVLEFIRKNIDEICGLRYVMSSFVFIIAISVAVYALLFVLFRLFSNGRNFPVETLTAYFVLLFFTYFPIKSALTVLSGSVLFGLAWVVCVLSGAVALYFMLKTAVGRLFFKSVIVVVVCSECIYSVYGLWTYSFPARTGNVSPVCVIKKKPNVYFFLLDAYPNESTLCDIFSEGGELSKELRGRGFCVAKNSFSNYGETIYSLTSQLRCDYHAVSKRNGNIYIPKIPYKTIYTENETIATFKSSGYRYVCASEYPLLMFIGKMLRDAKNRGIVDKIIRSDESAEKQARMIIAFFSRNFLSQTVLKTYTKLLTIGEVYSEPALIEKNLDGLLVDKKPFFLFAHFFQVHDGVITEAGLRKSNRSCAFINDKCKKEFRAAVFSFNSKILSLIDCILKKDKGAVVIVNSDHGVALKEFPDGAKIEWSNMYFQNDLVKVLKYRYRNLVAVRIPEFSDSPGVVRSMFGPRVSCVNIFRVVFNYLGASRLKLLNDRIYHHYFHGPSLKKSQKRREVAELLREAGANTSEESANGDEVMNILPLIYTDEQTRE
ncbi:hypothetical protein HYD_4680 [Candidatus Hydrogenosomobacter endosymbioticus]|uniref:Sulfatase N-terminal domain-containing protein n=1 Tax=Candidatus Hydrogenosomobacter endosymbioticus TaxID=2558174 RepID=A0ABN6L839_9PROT|nr:hypothetical protein HYD_4680 [Candidatus Hydrogenosomobacter endosymbioticus]